MSRPIRFAIIGCGGFAGYHANALADHADAELTACVDVRVDIAERFIANHLPKVQPKPPVHTDLSRMLAQVKPDAALIATPHAFHFEQAETCLDAGCHVFVEKPMVTRAADARRLQAKVRATGKVLVVGYNTPCTPEFDYLRRTIDNPHGPQGLGDLEVVTGYVSQNWMRWTMGKWRQDPKLAGGGMAFDTGAHLFNSLCWAVNEHVAEVFAFIDNHGRDVDINSATTVRFDNGVLAAIAVAGNCANDGGAMTFCFAGGRIEIDGWYGAWINVHNAYGKVKYPKVNTDLTGRTPLINFIDAIRKRDRPCATARHGVIQCELMDAIYESARTGRPARPNPGHDEAT